MKFIKGFEKVAGVPPNLKDISKRILHYKKSISNPAIKDTLFEKDTLRKINLAESVLKRELKLKWKS